MKQPLAVTCVALAVTVFVAGAAAYFSNQAEDQPAAQAMDDVARQSQPATNPAAEPEEWQYVLRAYQGRLAVYVKGESGPRRITNVYLSTLPAYDKGQLEQGVYIRDYDELVKRLEDYNS